MRSRPKVLFESWRGKYSDSPAAVSERLAEVRPSWRRLWVGSDPLLFPADVRTVARHTPAYFKDLFTADVLFCNDIVSRHMVKGPRLTYVQVWHGTPLKLIGHDERAPAYDAETHLARMDRDVAKWDYLVSPSAACTEMFRSAFRYDGPVWETGYPRNDVLSSPVAPEIRRRTREQLGIAPDAQVLLYVPTWRDNERAESGQFVLDTRLDAALLEKLVPEGTVLVSRMHSNVSTPEDYLDSRFVVDGNAVADVSALYLAADVLISDYSSAVYDFAVTGKPIVLFAPDLELYRDDVRGMYFDYDDWAPGPVTATTEEVADVVADLARVTATHAARYAAFRQRFCSLEDGRAAERVVDKLLGVLG